MNSKTQCLEQPNGIFTCLGKSFAYFDQHKLENEQRKKTVHNLLLVLEMLLRVCRRIKTLLLQFFLSQHTFMNTLKLEAC